MLLRPLQRQPLQQAVGGWQGVLRHFAAEATSRYAPGQDSTAANTQYNSIVAALYRPFSSTSHLTHTRTHPKQEAPPPLHDRGQGGSAGRVRGPRDAHVDRGRLLRLAGVLAKGTYVNTY